MVTLLNQKEFRITHQEMIKGIRKSPTSWLKYFDELVVPIIENTPEERDLKDRMAEVPTTRYTHTHTQKKKNCAFLFIQSFFFFPRR